MVCEKVIRKRALNRTRMFQVYRERHPLIEKIKIDRGCVDCGYNSNSAALHFDHRDPTTKLFKISGSYMRKWESILEEIDKCDVRCANCHAIKTQADSSLRESSYDALLEFHKQKNLSGSSNG